MSAVTGVFYRDGRPVNRDEIGRMVQTLGHRGPDGLRPWHKGPIGLGYCHRCITPESVFDRQPLESPEGDLCLVLDGRLDNRDDLITTLGLTNRAATPLTDAELLLASYRKWGYAAPAKLIGDFAFAIWDERQHVLFCARDPMGVKPFYYHLSDRLFAFGSEIKALLCLPELPRTLNERTILRYLVQYLEDKEHTFYDAVVRLPPAHAMTIGREGARRWQYWKLEPDHELCLASDEAYAEGFREVFTEAVRCRLRSAYPPGVMLSGGLDSSSVACVARQLYTERVDKPIKVFTAIFPGLPQEQLAKVDEREYVEAVVAQGGVEPHYTRGDLLSPLAGLEEMLSLHDEPFFVRGHYLIREILANARDQGVRVLLDGSEGDIAVSYGFDFFTELAYAGRWQEFATLAHTLARNWKSQNRTFSPNLVFWRYGLDPLTQHLKSGRWITFARQFNHVTSCFDISRKRVLAQSISGLVPQGVRKVWPNGRSGESTKSRLWVDPQFLKRMGAPKETSEKARTSREEHIRTLESGQFTYALEIVNQLSFAYGIEPRHPFYDRRVLEYCVALPPLQIFSDAWPRGILRRALEGVLPPKVQWRIDKARLGANVLHNLIRFERTRLDRLFLKEPDVLRPYVNVAAVQNLYRAFTDQPTMVRALPLIRVVVLSTWLQQTS
ncbi:MAG: lasso peptide isopeptide bond-forming cyclase [Candidatus Tectomicrobia bacterium]